MDRQTDGGQRLRHMCTRLLGLPFFVVCFFFVLVFGSTLTPLKEAELLR